MGRPLEKLLRVIACICSRVFLSSLVSFDYFKIKFCCKILMRPWEQEGGVGGARGDDGRQTL